MKALSLSLLALVTVTAIPSFAFEHNASNCTGNRLTLVGDTAGGGSAACVLAHAALRIDHESTEQYEGVYAFEGGELFTFRINYGTQCEVIVQGNGIHCDSKGTEPILTGATAMNLITLVKRAPRIVNLEHPVGQSYALNSQLGAAVVCSTDTRFPEHQGDNCHFYGNWR